MQTCQIEGCAAPVFVHARGLCRKHYSRWYRTGDPTAAKYDRGSGPDRWRQKYRVDPGGCWIWTASLDRHGYGQYDVIVNGRHKNTRAHRFVYQALVRELAANETLDHLCRVHACVNPAHLEPVSHAENVRRGFAGQHNAIKTHCAQGHEFTPENTKRIPGTQWRGCRECARIASRAAQRRKRGTSDDAVRNGEKTHCKNGHEFTPENTYFPPRGGRSCRECTRVKVRDYMRRRRAGTDAP